MDKDSLNRLEQQATIRHDEGFNQRLLAYRARTITELCKGPKILEVGCGDGLITYELAKRFSQIVAIDGSAVRINRVKERIKKLHRNVVFEVTLLEDFEPNCHFDTIVMTQILEHVKDPILALNRAKTWLKRNGFIIVNVPNAASLHRRVGKAMGLISELHELTEQDFSVGHERYYDLDILKEHITKSGLAIESTGGILLKPLSNAQMEQLSVAATDAFDKVGKELPPEYCAEIWARCTSPKGEAQC